uniref:Aspartyl/asparaginy/proline hydroxylase domain-containing protein n=1 Tax=Ditylenchus dipsaci TaxID=166011 RepID=A0A915CNN7_9BILA
MGRPNDAKNVFENVLNIDPTNNIAQAYYGYILKLYENELEKGVHWMRKGLKAEESILDSKFYFHLGDALTRLGRNQEAYKVYEEAVHLAKIGMFYLTKCSRRTLGTVLVGFGSNRVWQTSEARRKQWIVIREEAVDAWNQFESNFETESNRLSSDAQKVLYLRKERQFQKSACRMLPNTCDILQNLLNDSSCIKDQIKISVMTAGSRLWPHCGTTNYELEAQLGLQTSSEARIRVSQETKGWKAGKFIVFDNSFETEMWFDGAGSHSMRMVLSLNLWHPHVPKKFRENSDEI